MKKSYLMIAAAAIALASCTSEKIVDTVQEDQAQIGFQSYIDNMTRAELTNDWFTASGDAFGVYGFKGTTQIFNNEVVTYDGSDWVHTTVRFWDKAATNYEFYAHAPQSATHTFADKKYTFTSLAAAPIVNIETVNADLAIANPLTGFSYANCCTNPAAAHNTDGVKNHVEFTFNHILSKLSFLAKTNLDVEEDGSGDVKKITIKEIYLDFPTATAASWAQASGDAVAGATTFTGYTAKDGSAYETEVFDDGVGQDITETAAEIGNTFIVAPVNATVKEHVFGIKVKYDITYNDDTVDPDCISYGVLGGGSETAPQYKPNQNDYYVVTLVVGPEKIEFCVDKINDWTEKAAGPVVIND